MENKVSVIVPMYNAEKSIRKTLDSIKNQSYKNFEVLIVDDQSTDGSISIIENEYMSDSRFKLLKLTQKGGASIARNLAISNSTGRYVAFLDADDTWESNKLEKQIEFMISNNYVFSYTNYTSVDTDSGDVKKICSPSLITYKELLKYNSIGCLTVVYNQDVVGLVQIDKLEKRNDYALWLTILRKGFEGHLLNEDLSTYFISKTSLSNNYGKINLLKYHYKMFKNNLNYSIFISLLFTLRNLMYILFIKKIPKRGNKCL